MRTGQHQFSTVGHFRGRKLGLKLLQVFECLTILMLPIQGRTEEKIGVVEQVRLRIRAEKSTKQCDGFLGLPGFDHSFGLTERRMVRGSALGRFGGGCRGPLSHIEREREEENSKGHTGSGEWPR